MANVDRENAIEKQPWYWGDLNRDEAAELLQNGDNGQFLVRDSTKEGEYTLVIKTKDLVRCVRILKWDSNYGIAFNQCTFPSVVSLMKQLLDQPSLLHLSYPHLELVSPLCKTRLSDTVTTDELLRQLVSKTKDSIHQHNWHDTHVRQRKMTGKDMQSREWTINSLRVVLTLYEDHLCVNAEIHKHLSMNEITSLVDNKNLTQDRVSRLREKLEAEQSRWESLRAEDEGLLMTISQHKPTLTILAAEQGQLMRMVEERGIEKEYLDLLLREEKDVNIAHLSQKFWLMPQCDRQGAERALKARDPGTFLVRPGKVGYGSYVLSVVSVFDDSVKTNHCIIHHDPQHGYGFHPEYCIFTTLEELVIKHRAMSLRFYNPKLDVCLTYPVNYQHDTARTWHAGHH